MPSTLLAPKPISTVEKAPVKIKPHRPWWRNILELPLALIVAVFALELLFKQVNLGGGEFMEPDAQLGARHIAGKLVSYRMEGFSNDHFSSIGLRDVEHSIAKPANVTRIALLGDSATEGMQVPMPCVYSRRLEAGLNQGLTKPQFEVFNFGTSSYSTVQQLLQFNKLVPQFKPDVVMLMYNRGDSLENIFVPGPGAASQPRPYAYLDDAGKLQIDNQMLKACAYKFRPDPIMSFLRSNSRIYGVMSQTCLQLSIKEHEYRKIVSWIEQLYMKLPFVKDKFVPFEVPYAKQDSIKVTTELLKELHQRSKEIGARFILVMFPNAAGDADYVIQEYAFQKLAAAEGIECIDLTDTFAHAPKERGRLFLEYHFSPAGHQLVADELLKLLQRDGVAAAQK